MAKSDNQTKPPTVDIETIVQIAESTHYQFIGVLFVDRRDGTVAIGYGKRVPAELRGQVEEKMSLHTIATEALFQ